MSDEKERTYAACACGEVPEKLVLEIDRNSKVGRAVGTCCGTWGVDFLRGSSMENDQILDKAQAAWEAAPRAVTTPAA